MRRGRRFEKQGTFPFPKRARESVEQGAAQEHGGVAEETASQEIHGVWIFLGEDCGRAEAAKTRLRGRLEARERIIGPPPSE